MALYEAAETQEQVFLHAAQRLRTSLDAMLPQGERQAGMKESACDFLSTVEHIQHRLETLREFVFRFLSVLLFSFILLPVCFCLWHDAEMIQGWWSTCH